VKTNAPPLSRAVLAALSCLGLAIPACEPPEAPRKSPALPPAYTSNLITDPALVGVIEEIRDWTLKRTGAEEKPLYSRVEVLHPVKTVQPYGVGVFQQESRLPVILTTGPGWEGLSHEQREAAVAEAFNHIQDLLKPLHDDSSPRCTLTVQTPLGIELAWINHLDPSGHNVHGND
jgi:hypothetical protein